MKKEAKKANQLKTSKKQEVLLILDYVKNEKDKTKPYSIFTKKNLL